MFKTRYVSYLEKRVEELTADLERERRISAAWQNSMLASMGKLTIPPAVYGDVARPMTSPTNAKSWASLRGASFQTPKPKEENVS
jgi:hypothetical protein